MQDLYLLGNKITSLSVDELNDAVKVTITAQRKALILHTNAHGINLAADLPWLRDFRNSAEIVHCDGAGVSLGLRLQGQHVACRITVHDWMSSLADLCEKSGFSIYFLGAEPGIAARAADRLRALHPLLKVAGTHHGFFLKHGAESDDVVTLINRVRPNILVVGFGMPMQEEWLMRNWLQLDVNVFVAAGGCFNFLSGAQPWCPRWMANHGLEWLFRLAVEPRRLFARYVIGNPKFLFSVMRERISASRRRSS